MQREHHQALTKNYVLLVNETPVGKVLDELVQTARISDQSEVTISGRLANQITGKRTNQKGGYKKKQPIDFIDTKSLFYKKKAETREQRHTLPSTCHVNQNQKCRKP